MTLPPRDAERYIPAFERTLSTTISASGTVQATQSVALTFGSAGKIATVNVKIGDKVVAGQELATLDSTQLQSALRSAQTSLASAQAKLSDVVNPSAADSRRRGADGAQRPEPDKHGAEGLDDLKLSRSPLTSRQRSRALTQRRARCSRPRKQSPRRKRT